MNFDNANENSSNAIAIGHIIEFLHFEFLSNVQNLNNYLPTYVVQQELMFSLSLSVHGGRGLQSIWGGSTLSLVTGYVIGGN